MSSVRKTYGVSKTHFVSPVHKSLLPAATYVLEDGTAEDAIGLSLGGDIICLNEFAVIPGAEVITSVEIAWGAPSFPDPSLDGLPYTVALWSDPNGDGDPTDAVLLTTASGVVAFEGTDTFITTDISPTLITTPNFFVGFLITHQAAQFPAALDETDPTFSNSSYLAGDSVQGNIEDLNSNEIPVAPVESFGFVGNWLIRADSTATSTPFQDIASAGLLTHIYIGNELSVQVTDIADGTTGEFYPPGTIPGDCGTFVAMNEILYAPDFGSHGGTATVDLGDYTPFTPVSQTGVTGSGTATDPFKVVTVVAVGATGLDIQQTDSYVIGNEFYQTDILITNNSESLASGLLYRAGDAFLNGSDSGFGFTEIFGDRKSIGCSLNANNLPPDRIEEWVPLTDGNNFYEDVYSSIWLAIGAQTPFPDTCVCETAVDNGAGISWSFSIPAASTAAFSQITAFSPVGMEPLVTSKTADSPTSTPGGEDGYTITIENPNSGSVTLNSITDTLPDGFSYVPGSSTGVTTSDPSITGQMLTWSGPFSVPANGAVSLHFVVTVGSVPGDYFNEAGGEAAGGFSVAGSGPTAQITVTVAPPVITSELSATGTVGQAFNYTITATNNPTSFDAMPLPNGLGVDTGTGVISGTPTIAGTLVVTISATNAGGTGTALLTLTVNPAPPPPPPVITSGAFPIGVVGQPFSYQITASNNPTSFDATGLPLGLTRDTGTGLISGTPTVAGSFMVTISATNAGGAGSKLLTLTVNPAPPPPPPVITSGAFPAGVVGQPFSYQITASNNPTSFDAVGLPLGLTRDTGTGLISGTPSEDGNFTVTISASNAGGTGSKTQDLNVTGPQMGPAPTIISPSTATATVGQFYVYQIVATFSPTSYDAPVDQLPPGLQIDTALGFISGTPTVAGSFMVTISATNNNGTGPPVVLTITVQPKVSDGISIISGTSATGRTLSPFSFQVVTSGATSAATLSATGLPPGLSFDPMTPGEISGVPTSDGSFSVTLTVIDGGLTTKGTLQLTFTSDPAVPVITSPNSAFLIPMVPFRYQIVAESSSTEDTTFAVIGPLPLGLMLDSNGLISGTPLTSFGFLPSPRLALGVITNTTVACNSKGCGVADLFYKDPTGAQEISTRLSVGTDDHRLIGGFIIIGDTPTTPPLKLVVRGIGPSLPFGAGNLANPLLELDDSTPKAIASNDNWKDDYLEGESQEVAIENTGLAPNNPMEAAILAVLHPGAYTAILSGGANNGTGVGLVEIYNLKVASLDESAEAHLGNISTRGYVQPGDNVMIGGFFNAGKEPMQVLVRAIGPSLTQFGVTGALANPFLELHDSAGKTIEANDDWGADPDKKADIIATGLAPMDPLESAILLTLPAEGNTAYTAIVSGANSTSGVALVEIYFGNPCLGTSCP